jgi:spermidine/putrescine-binding protein
MGRLYFIILTILSSLATPKEIYANQSKSVRVLTWWGYIDPRADSVKTVERKCKARVSLDEFYSNAEFLDRVGNQRAGNRHDILIFSDTVIKASQTAFIGDLKARLDSKSKQYFSGVKEFFVGRKYNPATAVFQISLTGFLVNKSVIAAGPKDKLSAFFKDSKDKIFVLLDDHVEIATLLNKWECTELDSGCKKKKQLAFPSEDKLKKLVGQSKVVISSDLADITKHPKFALAYTWSGDAIQKLSAQPNLDFILHPSLSHSSMDLLTLVGESKEASCVANEFASKKFIDSVAQKSKYFSPYGPVQSEDKAFNKLQQEFFQQFSTLGRIHQVTQEESLEIDKKWQLFKILFGSKI